MSCLLFLPTVLPTIRAFLQLLPAGFRGEAYRSTDNVVFVAVEGAGRTACGDQVFDWRAHDVFVVPGWSWVRHEACGADAVLFSFSDCALQEKIGLWRSERAASSDSRIETMTQLEFIPTPLPSVEIAGKRSRFPIHRIYCVGRNYEEHRKEMGAVGRDPRAGVPWKRRHTVQRQ
ncbi:MAG: hypothetical protein ACREXP_28650 [Steroidobacteraceae bacterium]